jgi:23S rRNA (cytidine1920-2'-O)/16S rRNA (cytidine1409-2'-O)-methyltransferase
VLEKIASFSAALGFVLKQASFSPITGGEGNIEFLFHLHNPLPDDEAVPGIDLKAIVQEAHSQLK